MSNTNPALLALQRMTAPPPAAPARSSLRAVRARFDAAQWTPENARHWQHADSFSANAAITPSVRRTLRNRCRYEVANNSYARGIILTLANDTVGTGPRLHMTAELSGSANVLNRPAPANSGAMERAKRVNTAISKAFEEWSLAVNLAEKLRTARISRAQDGEAFLLLTDNELLPTPVKLDLRLLEADQIASPTLTAYSTPTRIDGISYDALTGEPVSYDMLKYHPGDNWSMPLSDADIIKVPAANMLHYYRPERPGQRRGLPEIMPALPLFALLRRYTLAVIAAAETAADFAAVLFTDSPANGQADDYEPLDTVDLERRMATVLPGGWKLGQIHAEQPTTTYKEFKAEILNEIARCLNMPFNVAACNSSSYNYSSGQLDHLTYFKSIRVDQTACERILDRLFRAWFDEAVLVEGYLPPEARALGFIPTHQWFWDGREHADPTKIATANETELRAHTTTLRSLYARRGLDWEEELRQRGRELALAKELGLDTVTPAPGTGSPGMPGQNATHGQLAPARAAKETPDDAEEPSHGEQDE